MPCSSWSMRRSTARAPTSVLAISKGLAPPRARCGRDSHCRASPRSPSNRSIARPMMRDARKSRSDSSGWSRPSCLRRVNVLRGILTRNAASADDIDVLATNRSNAPNGSPFRTVSRISGVRALDKPRIVVYARPAGSTTPLSTGFAAGDAAARPLNRGAPPPPIATGRWDFALRLPRLAIWPLLSAIWPTAVNESRPVKRLSSLRGRAG